jgi:hypothetical protein
MAGYSTFESRTATVSCSPEEYYNFITNLNNFDRFIPSDLIKDWKADENSCSFTISRLGDFNLKVSSGVPFSSVVYSGKALVTINFNLHAIIDRKEGGDTTVRLVMEADISPVIKIFAAGPVDSFLEMLVKEMENFNNWHNR